MHKGATRKRLFGPKKKWPPIVLIGPIFGQRDWADWPRVG